MNEIISDSARNNQMKNAQNPETYAFLAMACYLYLNPPSGAAPAVYYGGWPHSIKQFEDAFPPRG